MKILFVVSVLIVTACTQIDKVVDSNNTSVTRGKTRNFYELIQVGPYTCIGMANNNDGSVGLWCEKTVKE
jgi:hypothetical protein